MHSVDIPHTYASGSYRSMIANVRLSRTWPVLVHLNH
jgi:hypothetical protein